MCVNVPITMLLYHLYNNLNYMCVNVPITILLYNLYFYLGFKSKKCNHK